MIRFFSDLDTFNQQFSFNKARLEFQSFNQRDLLTMRSIYTAFRIDSFPIWIKTVNLVN